MDLKKKAVDYFSIGIVLGLAFGVFASFYNPYLIIPFLAMLFLGWMMCQ